MTPSEQDTALMALLAAASEATDGDVVARAILHGPLAEFGAMRVALYVASADGTALHMAGHSGGDEVRHLYSTMPVDASTPNGVAFTSGIPQFLTLIEVSERYPVLAAGVALYTDLTTIEFATVPIRSGGQPIGVLGVLFSTPMPRSWGSKAALDATCAVAGLWSAAQLTAIRAHAGGRTPILSQRQRAVLRFAALGLTNAQIATQLGFAESTVKADLTQLYRLVGATSRQDLLDRTRDLT